MFDGRDNLLDIQTTERLNGTKHVQVVETPGSQITHSRFKEVHVSEGLGTGAGIAITILDALAGGNGTRKKLVSREEIKY